MTAKKEQEFEKKLDNLTTTTNRILSYIETDSKTGRLGIFEQQNLNIKKIENNTEEIHGIQIGIKTDKKVLAGKVTVLGFVGGGIIWLIKLIF